MKELSAEDVNLVGVLPPGEWRMAAYQDMVILISPVHAPRVLQDGKMTRLDPVLVNVSPESNFVLEAPYRKST